ncbi:MAG TPA: XdhC family protein [Pseudonocardiaceae bacterium]|jgi:hypothetical protein|nr:XdhC family protein [Pseudonocardiaceae bacterium]
MKHVSTEDSIIRRRAGEALQRWAGEGRATAVVRVLERHGFGTVQPGQLLAAGLTEAELAHLHGPVGLDLGAGTAAETAVSVVAEVIAARSGRAGTPLGGTAGRIGG